MPEIGDYVNVRNTPYQGRVVEKKSLLKSFFGLLPRYVIQVKGQVASTRVPARGKDLEKITKGG